MCRCNVAVFYFLWGVHRIKSFHNSYLMTTLITCEQQSKSFRNSYEMTTWGMYCTVLYCTVLYWLRGECTVRYCTVLYCTVLYCTSLSHGRQTAAAAISLSGCFDIVLTSLFPVCCCPSNLPLHSAYIGYTREHVLNSFADRHSGLGLSLFPFHFDSFQHSTQF